MIIKFKNWLIKFAVKGLVKAGKADMALSLFKEIVKDLEIELKIKK